MSEYENPFSELYLAEEFVRETENIINRNILSPEIFGVSEVVSFVREPMNHFVIGVPGSGKTMILAFLRTECLSFINTKKQILTDFRKIWHHIGNGLWGLYHGLLLNPEFLSPKDFTGFGLDPSRWTDIFSDFLNTIYLKQMLTHLKLDKEHYISNWLGFNNSRKKELINNAIKDFTRELDLREENRTLEGLLKWAEDRTRHYQKMIKERATPQIDENEIPKDMFFKEIGYLPLRLVQKLRSFEVLHPSQKVLFIIDEYDQCDYAKQGDFARSINSFVKLAARGAESSLFVKIGTRPHGFYDKRILNSDAKIEEGRDYNEINLGTLLKGNTRLFSKLVQDIANRRLKRQVWFVERKATNINKILNKISPSEEGELYQHGKANQDLHFKVLEYFTKTFLPYDIDLFSNLVNFIRNAIGNPLYQKYLIIISCRQLKRLRGKKPEHTEDAIKQLFDKLKEMGEFLNLEKKEKENSKIYYLLKDLREPALFLLSSDFRHPKYYCGFHTIKLMSEGIILNFIKLCRAIFDELNYKQKEFEATRKISIIWQNRAIRKVASKEKKGAMYDLACGQDFLIFLDELGFIFRKMQIDPCAPYPTPNGFSISNDVESDVAGCSISCDGKKVDPILSLKRMLRDATDWGYLIKMTHRSKTGSFKERTKYYINSILAPYYDLSVRHSKEPFYIYELEDLTDLMLPDVKSRQKKRSEILGRIKYLDIIDLEQK